MSFLIEFMILFCMPQKQQNFLISFIILTVDSHQIFHFWNISNKLTTVILSLLPSTDSFLFYGSLKAPAISCRPERFIFNKGSSQQVKKRIIPGTLGNRLLMASLKLLWSPIIRKMQVKITMRYHFIPVGMGIIKMTRNKKYWQRCGEKRTLVYSSGGLNWYS